MGVLSPSSPRLPSLGRVLSFLSRSKANFCEITLSQKEIVASEHLSAPNVAPTIVGSQRSPSNVAIMAPGGPKSTHCQGLAHCVDFMPRLYNCLVKPMKSYMYPLLLSVGS